MPPAKICHMCPVVVCVLTCPGGFRYCHVAHACCACSPCWFERLSCCYYLHCEVVTHASCVAVAHCGCLFSNSGCLSATWFAMRLVVLLCVRLCLTSTLLVALLVLLCEVCETSSTGRPSSQQAARALLGQDWQGGSDGQI